MVCGSLGRDDTVSRVSSAARVGIVAITFSGASASAFSGAAADEGRF